MKSENILIWVQNWYQSQCDGDWEHQNGITISTSDNPGWRVTIDIIDLIGADLNHLQIEYKLFKVSESDWYGYEIKDGKYNGIGDPSKLEFLLENFKVIIEQHKTI